jgi:cytochrome c biogenesis protein CcdA
MGETEQGGAGRLAGLTVATLALVVLVVLGSRLLSPATGTGGAASVPLWTLVPVAYLAGVLALLSPCSGAILPAFFAYGLDGKGQLVRRTYVFYLGLALVFVPVSGASSLVNDLVLDHQDVVFAVGGAVLIAFGLVALLGVDLGRLLAQVGIEPSRVGQGRVHGAETEDGKLYLLGAVFGFATSSCTAPILGSLVALTVSTGLSALAGVGLFLVFGLGIVTPLFAMAVLFEDSDAVRRVAGADPITLRVGRFERRVHPVHWSRARC